MSKQQEAEIFFQDLSRAYRPVYFPSEDEKHKAIFELTALLHTKSTDKEAMITKIKRIGVMHGDHRTKVTTLVLNKFWEMELDFGVEANRYQEED